MKAAARRPAHTHLELIDVLNEAGSHVRAWHSPARWAQVATEHLAPSPAEVSETLEHPPAAARSRIGRSTPTCAAPQSPATQHSTTPASIGQPSSTLQSATPHSTTLHAPPVHSNTMQSLLRDAGVLVDTDNPDPPRILLLGTGALAARLAPDLMPLSREVLVSSWQASLGAESRASAGAAVASWQAELASSTPRRRVALVRGDPFDRASGDTLVVVASDTVETDRGLLGRLRRSSIPHVVVGAHHDRAWVGPFWTPDAPTCASCQDHWLAQVDPDYPAVLAELCRRPAHPDDITAAWAASTLTAHLSRPDLGRTTLTGRVEVFDRAEPLLREVVLQGHPRCSCRQHLDQF